MSDFTSEFKPLYGELEQPGITVSAAVQKAVEFEKARILSVPRIYVSTAITSSGYIRDKSLSPGEVIAANNRSATMLMTELAEYKAPHLAEDDVMLPTELGHVPEWADSTYILLYSNESAGPRTGPS